MNPAEPSPGASDDTIGKPAATDNASPGTSSRPSDAQKEVGVSQKRPQDPKEKKQRPRAVRYILTILKFLVSQWLVLGLGIACLLAYLFPNVAANNGIIRSQFSILYGAVAIIFLVSGLNIPHEKLVQQLGAWRIHLITQIMSFLIFPAIFIALVHIMLAGGGIDTGILTGIVVVSCIPTTISSNVVMTRMSGGETAAAMVEVVIGNVLGPFITPGLTLAFIPNTPLFAPWRPIETAGLTGLYRSVFKQMGLSVLIPLFVGQAIQWLFPKQTKWVLDTFYLAKVSTFCLILLVWTTFSTCFQSGALYEVAKSSVICDVFFNFATYLFFTGLAFTLCRPPTFFARFDPLPLKEPLPWPHLTKPLSRYLSTHRLYRRLTKRETIAVCFCAAAKTTGLGIPMVAAMWNGSTNEIRSQIEIPVVLYTTEQIFFAQGFVFFFRWWLKRGEDQPEEEEEEFQGPVAAEGELSAQIEKEGGVEGPARPEPAMLLRDNVVDMERDGGMREVVP